MTIYRLGSNKHPANDGLGASLYGGRWNHKGTPVIYAAASRALCALEVLANANELPSDYAIFSIDAPDDFIATLSLDALPPNWDAGRPTDQTRDLGSAWARDLTSAVLSIPSVVISKEYNYLLNPRHPDFIRIQFGAPEAFYFDERLIKMVIAQSDVPDAAAPLSIERYEEVARQALRILPHRDREILRRFYVLDQSEADICREMNLQSSEVRMIRKVARALIKEIMGGLNP